MNIANKLTTLRVLLIPVFIVSYMFLGLNSPWPGIIFIIAAFTDFLDGHLARSRGLITTFGQFADPLADKILTISAYIMLSADGIIPAWSLVIIVAREFIISGFRIIAASNDVTIAAGPLGKIKTVFQMLSIIGYLFMSIIPKNISDIVYAIAVVFTVLSLIDYLNKNKNVLDLDNI